MPKVTFTNQAESLEMTVEGEAGDSLLEIALNNDVPIQSACGGFCSCTTCHVHVVDGAGGLTPGDEEELDRLEDADDRVAASRLGCQARLTGTSDVRVEIVNLDP